MAAELLDIEAKLDTSQVQGQLNQLSKTSGLQNLDRAIKTLETSMKRLSQTMDRQAQNIANGGGTSLEKSSNLLGGKFIRGIGGYVVGRTLAELGEATGNKTLKTAGKFAGGIAKGAAVGSMVGSAIPGVGTVAGAGIGVVLGALQAAFESLAASTRELQSAMQTLSQQLNSTNRAATSSQTSYLERMWQHQIAGMSGPALDSQRTAAQKELEAARRNEALAQDRLREFQTPLNMSILESGTKPGHDKAYVEHVQKLQDEYAKLVQSTVDWAEKVKNAEGHLNLIEKRQSELAHAEELAAREAQRLAQAEERLAQQRDKIRKGFGTDIRSEQHRQNLEAINNSFSESQASIRGNVFTTTAQLQQARQQYSSTLQEAMNSDTPEQFIDKLADMKLTISELEDVLEAWQAKLEEQTSISISEMLSKSVLPAVGSLNSLEKAGYFGMASQDKTIEDLTQQILNYVRRITANTETTSSTNNETFGNY